MPRQSKRAKGAVESVVDQIRELIRQPLSDQSNEVPSAKAIRRSKTVAGGQRRIKATKARNAKTSTRKRTVTVPKGRVARGKKKR
jgi:hypothetical protein